MCFRAITFMLATTVAIALGFWHAPVGKAQQANNAPFAPDDTSQNVPAQTPEPFSDSIGTNIDAGNIAANRQSIYPDIPQFGGPNSVGGILREDNELVDEYRWQGLQDRFNAWFEFKASLNEKYGLQFGINNTLLYQHVSPSPNESHAASYNQQILGQWELLNRNQPNVGLLVFETFYRDKVGTQISAAALGNDAGSILPTALTYNEFSFTVSQLFWKRYPKDRGGAYGIGRIDPASFVDVYPLASPQLHFTNFAFSSNPTVPFPDPGLGAVAGGLLTDHFYVEAGFSDANGKITRSGFDTFFGDAEYFSFVEAGFTSEEDRLYLDNIHLTMWHIDPRKVAGTGDGWGVLFSMNRFIDDKWLPFFRFGYSHGDTALLQTNFSTGLGYRNKKKDVAGIGVSWGKPADGTLRDQFTSELFYRIQLTQFLAVTPQLQFVADPALNPSNDFLTLFGLRLRTSF